MTVSIGCRRAFTCLRLLVMAGAARAAAQQDVISQIPDSTAAALQQAGIHLDQSGSGLDVGPSSGESPFSWGPFVLSPHPLYRFLYGNGIQASPGHSSLTAINTFAPGFLLAVGSSWIVDYTPTWDLYSNPVFKDTLGQAVSLIGSRTFHDWSIRFTQGYVYSSQPLVETGAQTTEQIYTTDLTITHRLDPQWLLETDLDQSLQYTVGFPSTSDWSGLGKLHYQFSPRIDAAIGADLGFVSESEGPDEAYLRPTAELTWSPTDKVSMDVSGGAEHREFFGDPWTSLNTPIFDLAVHYSPFQATKLSLTAGRHVAAALFADQITRTTQWVVSIEQRLLTHFFLTGSFGYNDVDYLATGGSSADVRSDNDLSYSVRFSTTLLKRATISVLYQGSHNSSTIPVYGFSSGQIGAEFQLRY
jgi:hypothetical protein